MTVQINILVLEMYAVFVVIKISISISVLLGAESTVNGSPTVLFRFPSVAWVLYSKLHISLRNSFVVVLPTLPVIATVLRTESFFLL